MKVRTILYLLLAVSLSLVSCDKEDTDQFEQDRIFGSYELFYDSDNDLSYATATFRLDSATGIKLELSDKSNVYFEGERLSWVASGAYYQRSFEGITASGTFEYVDLNGNSYSNSVSLHVLNYPLITDTLPRSEDYTLNWSGDPLGADEWVELTITDVNSDTKTFSATAAGASSVTADSTNLKTLGAGLSTWALDRIYSPDAQNATPAGATIFGRFRPVTQQVVLN